MAQAQHHELCWQLQEVAEVVELPPVSDLSLDAVYAHDSSLPTDYGVIMMSPGKANRRSEARRQADLYRKLGIRVLGEIRDPGTTEAGDMCGWIRTRCSSAVDIAPTQPASRSCAQCSRPKA